jgi:hypothetical protein
LSKLMKLRRKAAAFPSGKRQRPPAEPGPGAPKFAYRANRSSEELNLGRQLQRQAATATPKKLSRFLLQRFGLIILVTALLVSSVNILSLSSDVRIMPLTTGSNASLLHDQAAYQAAARRLIGGSIWNRNKITINTARIDQQLLKQFPELSSASITLPLLSKRPILYVQALQPALVLNARNGSFVVDTTGKALLSANSLSPTVRLSLPLVTDQGGLRVSLNHQALTAGDVSFIQVIVGQLAARHFSASSMVLPAAASELDVRLNGQPYAIKFNLENSDARQQVGTFLATQAQLQSQKVTPAQYIDVRVDGRAYYQ